MQQVIIGAVILAAIATGLAFFLTYWYWFVGAGAIAFGVYAFIQNEKDEGNKV